MRTVVYGAACSLDGFITAADGSVDWLHWSTDVSAIMETTWKNTDAMLMGRKTWEFAMKAAPGGGGQMAGIESYVFSRTLEPSDVSGATLVSDDAGGFVRDLKKRKGKDIVIMGGGDLGRALFEADVVDRVGLNVHPVLLGAGTRLFLDAGHRVHLELTECRPLAGGCVLLDYRVKRGSRSRRS